MEIPVEIPRLRQSVGTGFQELLELLGGSTERDVLTARVWEIPRLLDPLFELKQPRCNIVPCNPLRMSCLENRPQLRTRGLFFGSIHFAGCSATVSVASADGVSPSTALTGETPAALAGEDACAT